jgi:hypothetical protein
MTKQELLSYLAESNGTDAAGVADDFGTSYFAAAMALLRLSRQSLVSLRLDPDTGTYWYEITDRGLERLDFLQDRAT